MPDEKKTRIVFGRLVWFKDSLEGNAASCIGVKS